MKRLALAIVFVLGFVPPAWADFQAGFAAWDRGDYATALREWKPLAEQGDAVAQFNIGLMYGNGRGVPQDYAEAVKWYRKSAEQGYANAQNNIGLMYDNGQGVPQDYAEALKWFRKAAEQGVPRAQRNLGIMYHYGQGVPQDYVQAHKWYNLAASRLPSDEDRDLAVKNRDTVAPKMTAAQIAEAQRLARDWKPKTQAAPTPPLIDYARLVKESEIREVQLNLATLGYKPGPADGILGSRTRSAIEAFQRDQGLPATGEVSNEILLLLMWKITLQKSDLAPTKVELSD